MSDAIHFSVPVLGEGYAAAAQRAVMADKQEGLHSFTVGEAAPDRLQQAVRLVNKLIDAGVPWSALASCRTGGGTMGALIEAADNRLQEAQQIARSDDAA